MIATRSIQQHPPANTSKYLMTSRQVPSPPDLDRYGQIKPPADRLDLLHDQRRVYRQMGPQTDYLPAALRPKEFKTARATNIPTHPRAPDTPPQSNGNSFDSNTSGTGSPSHDISPSASFHQPLHTSPTTTWDPLTLSHNLSTHALIGQNPFAHLSEEVQGPPVTSHWKPDETSPACNTCRATFTWYFRRHHCRKCGFVVCGTHSRRTAKLDHNARFHPAGMEVRACDGCAEGYETFMEAERLSRENSLEEEAGSGGGTPTLNVPGAATPLQQQQQQGQEATVGAEARSFGGFYSNWSTF